MWDLGQVRVPTEIYPEALEGLLGRWELDMAHCGSKDTDSEGPGKTSLLPLFFLCLFHFVTLLVVLCSCFIAFVMYFFLFFYFYCTFFFLIFVLWVSLFFFHLFLLVEG